VNHDGFAGAVQITLLCVACFGGVVSRCSEARPFFSTSSQRAMPGLCCSSVCESFNHRGYRLIVGQTTLFRDFSGSRNLRVARGQKECLSQGPLSDNRKERLYLLGVKGKPLRLRRDLTPAPSESTKRRWRLQTALYGVSPVIASTKVCLSSCRECRSEQLEARSLLEPPSTHGSLSRRPGT
jgi:hypothetical protein